MQAKHKCPYGMCSIYDVKIYSVLKDISEFLGRYNANHSISTLIKEGKNGRKTKR